MSASSSTIQGYQCEFVSTVPEDFYCQKCSLVARELTLTKCCEETYCKSCINDIQSGGKPCPTCGGKEFSTFHLKKYIRRLNSLKVYCSMKERGCVWSGTLDQLDTHLDPHLDNCQYVDIKCPLNCLQTVPKNKVDQHVAQECTKRPHVCQHCGFKAIYKEVVDTHLPECKYVPLKCPNMCGVSCEREVMEDHMKICRLEEVECEFSSVGCDGRFIREDQDEHTRQNSQKHLTLTASLAVETKEQLQQKLLEQDKNHKKEEEKLRKKIEKQGKKLGEYERRLREYEACLGEQKKDITELKKTQHLLTESYDWKMKLLEQKLQILDIAYDKKISDCTSMIGLNRRFLMANFSKEKAKDTINSWKSPAMYTHVCGYKFCIGVDANGWGPEHGSSIHVYIWSMPGEFDSRLPWPVAARFTIELINQQGGQNAMCTSQVILNKSGANCYFTWLGGFHRIKFSVFIVHSELQNFLDNDTLHFFLSRVEF